MQVLSLATRASNPTMPQLPFELTHLSRLTYVCLDGLWHPLPTLRHLPALKALLLKYSPSDNVYQFPICLSHLCRLRSLALWGVRLGSSAQQISRFTLLTCLDLDANCFEEDQDVVAFSAALGSLASLQELSMTDQFIMLDGLALSALSRLTCLDLTCVPLEAFTCSPTWQALQELCFTDCNLLSMPAGLNRLSPLTRLCIAGQSPDFQLAGPLDFLVSMPHLRLLDLDRGTRYEDGGSHDIWSPNSLCCLMEAKQGCALRGQNIRFNI